MHLKKILAIAAVSALTFFSAAAEDSDSDVIQREINVITGTHSFNLNPHTASYANEAQILSGLYEGLFSYNPVKLEPINGICESYKVSRDKMRWTFKLKDAKFSDGSPITAQTVKDSWMTLLRTPGAPFASLIDCIKNAQNFRNGKSKAEDVGIEVRNDKTLVVYLNEPVSHLPNILCHHSLSAVSRKKGVYSGAFVLESMDSRKIVLKKNENYIDAAKVLTPGINFICSNDSEENTWLFNNGKVDWIDTHAVSDKIIDTDCINVTANFGTTYLFFKPVNEPWNNTKIRQALLYAIPYDELRKDYYIKAETLTYPLSGYPKLNGIKDYDAEDALSMMNEARDELGIPRDKKLMIVFAITDSELLANWAKILTEAWKPLGVELILQQTNFESYNPSIATWDADLFLYSWLGDYADPLAFLELFRTGSTFNESRWSNADYDSLLSQASLADSSADRLKLLGKAEQILLDDAEIIPISHSISMHIVSKELNGWAKNTIDLHPLRYLFIKKSKENPIKSGTLIKAVR